MNDIQKQKPYTVSQIKNEKPNAPRTKAILSGYFANSMNGGHNKAIFFKKIMAGERHQEFRIKANIQMLTPKTPTYQNLKMTVRTYFVPNSRVWTNAEKYTAQKGGASVEKITEIPNIGGQLAERIGNAQTSSTGSKNIDSTQIWRDSFISTYIPRISNIEDNVPATAYECRYPSISVLPLRGRIAIYNDFERNKEYDSERQEYKEDTVSTQEWESYLPIYDNDIDFYTMRSRRENSYYTDYRTELQGIDPENPISEGTIDSSLLVEWASWESKIAEARSQAENAQLNDWDIIAKIRGSKKLTEGKVQLIGQNTFNLNYAAVTQNTYNTNPDIDETFQVMGKQGAYSYTEINIPLFAGMEFHEEGYIHVIATVSADSVFESAIDRNLMNITPLSEYRPDMEGDKFDVLYDYEMGTNLTASQWSQGTYWENVVGFKRKYSEYFKLPNVIGGDLTTNNYYEVTSPSNTGGAEWVLAGEPEKPIQIITNKTFQFFEIDATTQTGGEYYQKRIWKDYTDFLINKNQAIKNTWTGFLGDYGTGREGGMMIKGQNQIFFVGVATCKADLPINPEIADNYTKWGEH